MKPALALCAAIFFAALASAQAADSPDAAAKPNILFILADDLGWGDLHCYGNARIRTPNLDRLAKSGSLFTQFYVNGSVCSPSRAAFMTGQFPARNRIHHAITGGTDNEERSVGLMTVANAARIGGNGSLAGGLTLLSGAQFIFDPLASLGVTGAVTIEDSFGVSRLVNANGSAINWGAIADGTHTLINTTSTFNTISNFGSGNAADIGGGRKAYFQNGSLQLVVVPEPGTFALAGLGLAVAAAWARRRSR